MSPKGKSSIQPTSKQKSPSPDAGEGDLLITRNLRTGDGRNSLRLHNKAGVRNKEVDSHNRRRQNLHISLEPAHRLKSHPVTHRQRGRKRRNAPLHFGNLLLFHKDKHMGTDSLVLLLSNPVVIHLLFTLCQQPGHRIGICHQG